MTTTVDRGAPVQGAEFEGFFERHHAELGRLGYLLLGDHGAADDLTGDTLRAAWLRWPQLRRADDVLGEVRRLMCVVAARRVRRLARRRCPLGEGVRPRTPLHTLTPRGRACVTLRYAFGLPEREVASLLWMRVDSVRSQTAEGLAQLVAASGVTPHRGPGDPGPADRRWEDLT